MGAGQFDIPQLPVYDCILINTKVLGKFFYLKPQIHSFLSQFLPKVLRSDGVGGISQKLQIDLSGDEME